MRVGILTFHCAHNYGAVLQAYALQEFMKSLGHDVEIIDYRPGYLVLPYTSSSVKSTLFRDTLRLPLQPLRRLRQRRFDAFINNRLTLSRVISDGDATPQDYDAYIIGSDQIWNPLITDGDLVYFGKFKRPLNSLLIAYAASSEISHEGDALDFTPHATYLRAFSSISVREDILRKQIQPFVGTQVTTVVDPTLLVEPDVLDAIAGSASALDCVLVYEVKTDKKTTPVARRIKSANRIKHIVRLTPSVSKRDVTNAYSANSPEDFVSMFRSCRYVVTTSFHGVVFSIIYRKQFVCVMDGSRGNYRISNLLDRLGISNRMVYSPDEIPCDPINYDEVTERVDILRELSRNFLIDALSS